VVRLRIPMTTGLSSEITRPFATSDEKLTYRHPLDPAPQTPLPLRTS